MPGDASGGWSPALVLATLAALGALLAGRANWRPRPWGHPRRWREPGAWWRLGMYLAGVAMLALAGSPLLEPLANQLLSAHMLQYLLLSNVAPPLLILGWPHAAEPPAPPPALAAAPQPSAAPGLSAAGLGRVWARLPLVVVAGGLDLLVLFGWHVPGAYAAGLRSGWLHGLEQLSFLGAGLLFWWVVRHPGTGRAGYARTLACILLTAVPSSALGLILFVARTPWYAAALGAPLPWGVDVLQDQQLAGLILGIPPDTLDVLSAIGVIMAWLRAEERGVIEREERWG